MTEFIIIMLIWIGVLALTYYPAQWFVRYLLRPPKKRRDK